MEMLNEVAPISGMIMQDIMDECDPDSEVSIFEIHGTQDNVTYFDGDPNNNDGWGAYPSIPETMTFFNNLFNLQLLSTENLPNTNTNDGSTVTSEKYGSSNSCTEVWLYTVEGGGNSSRAKVCMKALNRLTMSSRRFQARWVKCRHALLTHMR